MIHHNALSLPTVFLSEQKVEVYSKTLKWQDDSKAN